MTWACVVTSSAETGSSQTISRGLGRQRPRDADALALAAAELVRVAVVARGVQADAFQQLPHPARRSRVVVELPGRAQRVGDATRRRCGAG